MKLLGIVSVALVVGLASTSALASQNDLKKCLWWAQKSKEIATKRDAGVSEFQATREAVSKEGGFTDDEKPLIVDIIHIIYNGYMATQSPEEIYNENAYGPTGCAAYK